MSITVYPDVIMPLCVFQTGVRGIYQRLNKRTDNDGGYEAVTRIWDATRREWEVGYKPMGIDGWDGIRGIYEVTDGGAFGFLMLDPQDQKILAGRGFLSAYEDGLPLSPTPGTGNGSTYRVVKSYGVEGSSRKKYRLITRPKTMAIYRNGAQQTIGASPGNYAWDANTGTAVFVPDSSTAPTSITVGATTQIVTAAPISGISMGGRLTPRLFAGADAALINGKSLSVTNVSGAGPTTYTLNVNTAGKTITINSGAARLDKFAQPSETMTAIGDFYTPVHFASDDLDWEIVRGGEFDNRLFAGPTCRLLEIREQ